MSELIDGDAGVLNNGDEMLAPSPTTRSGPRPSPSPAAAVHYHCDEGLTGIRILDDIRARITLRTRGPVPINPNNSGLAPSQRQRVLLDGDRDRPPAQPHHFRRRNS